MPMKKLTLFSIVLILSLTAARGQTNRSIIPPGRGTSPRSQELLLTPSPERLQQILQRREILSATGSNRLDTARRQYFDYGGVLVKLHRTSYNPIQLFNPFAPAKYGGLDTTLAVPFKSLPWTARANPPLPTLFHDPRTHEAEFIFFSVGR